MAYYSFTIITIFDLTSRKNIHLSMRKSVKRYNFKAAVLVLLMEWINEVRLLDDLGWHHIHTKFHDDRFGLSGNIKVTTSII
jgi:hypothetical protein